MDKTTTQFLSGLRDARNSAVWSEFCGRYRPVLLAFGRRLGLDVHDAQDAAQDALMGFVAAYRKGRYDREKGRLRTWLYAISSHKIRDLQRRRCREKVVSNAGEDTAILERLPDDHSISELWEVEWERAVLAACIDQVRREVKPASLRVLELCVFQKRSVDEVAADLGMTREAVLKARTRVLSRMREIRRSYDAE